jgi:hypothetical protein
MRKIETLKFWGAVGLLMGAIGFSTYCYAVNNRICRTLPGTGCSTIGTAACQENNGQMPSGCTSCSGTSALLSKVCVFSEGNDCTSLGPIPCGTTYYTGFCIQATNGNWFCYQHPVMNQTCPGSLVACE